MMFDETEVVDLTQPPRDPFEHAEAEVVESPSEPVEVPQETAQAPQTTRAKIGITFARTMDERARVMEERNESFIQLLGTVGVTDPEATASGVRGRYVNALSTALTLRNELGLLRADTADVRDTFENL